MSLTSLQTPSTKRARFDSIREPVMGLDKGDTPADSHTVNMAPTSLDPMVAEQLYANDTARLKFLEAGFSMLKQEFQRFTFNHNPSPSTTTSKSQEEAWVEVLSPAEELQRLHKTHIEQHDRHTIEVDSSNSDTYSALPITPDAVPELATPVRKRSYANVLNGNEKDYLSGNHDEASARAATTSQAVSDYFSAKKQVQDVADKTSPRRKLQIVTSVSPSKITSSPTRQRDKIKPTTQSPSHATAKSSTSRPAAASNKSPTKVTRPRSPIFATQQRSADRHRRASLPEAWINHGDRDAANSMVRPPLDTKSGHSPLRVQVISPSKVKQLANTPEIKRAGHDAASKGSFAAPTMSSRHRAAPHTGQTPKSPEKAPSKQRFSIRMLQGSRPDACSEEDKTWDKAPLLASSGNTGQGEKGSIGLKQTLRSRASTILSDEEESKTTPIIQPAKQSRIPRPYSQAHISDGPNSRSGTVTLRRQTATSVAGSENSLKVKARETPTSQGHGVRPASCCAEDSVNKPAVEADTRAPTTYDRVESWRKSQTHGVGNNNPASAVVDPVPQEQNPPHQWKPEPKLLSYASVVRSGLRAEAPQFVPGSKVSTVSGEANESHKETSTGQMKPVRVTDRSVINPADFISPDTWATFQNGDRRAIIEQRGYTGRTKPILPRREEPSGLSPNLDQRPAVPQQQTSMDTQGNVVLPRRPWQHRPQTQTNRPRFGRAPLPEADEAQKQGWTIGSARPGWWYGWRGGDGREIAFSGNRPAAEKDPYSPFNFHTGQHSQFRLQQDGVDSPSSADLSSPLNSRGPFTPSSAGSSCLNFEIVSAAEHLWVPSAGSAEFHRMGACHSCQELDVVAGAIQW